MKYYCNILIVFLPQQDSAYGQISISLRKDEKNSANRE